MATLTDAMKEMVKGQQCFVATVSAEGIPNIAPKRSTRVLDDSSLLYAEGTGKQTYKNIKDNPRVAVGVVNRETTEGYRFVGRAELLESGPIYDQVAKQMAKAGLPGPKAAVKVHVEEIYDLKPGPTAGTRII